VILYDDVAEAAGLPVDEQRNCGGFAHASLVNVVSINEKG
jgi:hypothetical protein